MQMLKDNIGVFDDVVSREWCEEVIAIMDAKIADKEGQTEDGDVDGVMFRKNRKRVDVSMEMTPFASLQPYEHTLKVELERCLNEYGQSITGQFANLWDDCETVQCKLQRTPPEGGFCVTHYEQGNDLHCSRRFAVWILYMNDLDISGGTEFLNQGLTLTPRAGRLAIWPAAYTHPHRSSLDLKDWKYICTGWFVYHCDEYPKEKSRSRASRS